MEDEYYRSFMLSETLKPWVEGKKEKKSRIKQNILLQHIYIEIEDNQSGIDKSIKNIYLIPFIQQLLSNNSNLDQVIFMFVLWKAICNRLNSPGWYILKLD